MDKFLGIYYLPKSNLKVNKHLKHMKTSNEVDAEEAPKKAKPLGDQLGLLQSSTDIGEEPQPFSRVHPSQCWGTGIGPLPAFYMDPGI